MSYTIYHANGTPVSIPDAIIDSAFYNPAGGSTGAGLGFQLIGDQAVNYGAPIAQNFLQMTENFASSTVPADTSSLQGQLWFHTQSSVAGELYVRTQDNTSGGILNWRKIVTQDSAGNVAGLGTVTATAFVGDGSGLTNVSTGGVTQIIAGANITISPSGGTGAVTINAAAGSAVVNSFNARTGAVSLLSTDVSSALGYTPGTVTSVSVFGTVGRITATGNPITAAGTVTLDLATSGVTANTYTNASVTVDQFGRVTSASSSSSVTTFNGRAGAVTLTSSDVTTAIGYTPGTGFTLVYSGVVTPAQHMFNILFGGSPGREIVSPDSFLVVTSLNDYYNIGAGDSTMYTVSKAVIINYPAVTAQLMVTLGFSDYLAYTDPADYSGVPGDYIMPHLVNLNIYVLNSTAVSGLTYIS